MTIGPSMDKPSGYQRIKCLARNGVRPALGHDRACTEDEVLGAIRAAASEDGCRCHVTHLFNVSGQCCQPRTATCSWIVYFRFSSMLLLLLTIFVLVCVSACVRVLVCVLVCVRRVPPQAAVAWQLWATEHVSAWVAWVRRIEAAYCGDNY